MIGFHIIRMYKSLYYSLLLKLPVSAFHGVFKSEFCDFILWGAYPKKFSTKSLYIASMQIILFLNSYYSDANNSSKWNDK